MIEKDDLKLELLKSRLRLHKSLTIISVIFIVTIITGKTLMNIYVEYIDIFIISLATCTGYKALYEWVELSEEIKNLEDK